MYRAPISALMEIHILTSRTSYNDDVLRNKRKHIDGSCTISVPDLRKSTVSNLKRCCLWLFELGIKIHYVILSMLDVYA